MATEKLDVKGKVCPYPVLYAKEKLNKMKAGDKLEVTVDYPPAKENVERLANSKGYSHLETKNEGTLYKIVIQKK